MQVRPVRIVRYPLEPCLNVSSRTVRRLLAVFLLLLIPVAWLAMKFDPYQIDGDAVAYMDLADLMRAHHWHGMVNSYWHPLYPACLALAQILFHPTRWNELAAYYTVNYFIFFAQVVAMLAFTTALARLRRRFVAADPEALTRTAAPLLSTNALRLLGLGLLVIASQRELSMGKVRPDGLLQALMLAALAALMAALSAETTSAAAGWAAAMGVFCGLAYLTKSFAFAVSLLSLAVLLVCGLWLRRRSIGWAALVAVVFLVPFAALTAPYVAALSHKYGHLDFGDSGALNYAWYSGDTEKMHLEPWMTNQFGTATVHLVHPERQLLASPGIYSYKAVPNGTYPDWFDPGYFNDGVKPHVRLRPLVKRDARNVALVFRYLFNHPEAWILLILLLLMGARFAWFGPPVLDQSYSANTSRLKRLDLGLRRGGFWLPVTFLGLAMWAIYGLVNIEERYVTLAYFAVLLPLFAALTTPASPKAEATVEGEPWLRRTAAAMVVLLAFLALGESWRIDLQERRDQPKGVPAWRSPSIFGAASGLQDLGLHPGDEIACMGTTACLYDHYWARLAGVRITTEIYAPNPDNLLEAWEDLPNRAQIVSVLKAQGAKLLVAHFNLGEHARETAEQMGWRQLGDTAFYALPLNLAFPPAAPVPAQPWVAHAAGNQ